jgi:hypothetical protein
VNAVLHERRKRCRICLAKFTPKRPMQVVCGIECAILDDRKQKAKKAKREKRAALVKLRTVSDWTKLAQARFNEYVRVRDEGLPCISCGEFAPPKFVGGSWDAGHFRSVGACPELRFEPLNCHRQCKSCNTNTQRGGRYVMPVERAMSIRDRYRAELIRRVGEEQVAWLEGPHEPKRYRIEDLIAIRDLYRRKTKELREAQK